MNQKFKQQILMAYANKESDLRRRAPKSQVKLLPINQEAGMNVDPDSGL